MTTDAIQIADSSDPRIAPYVAIRERDLTGRPDGRFIVEGRVTLDILVRHSRFQIESLFLSQSRLEPLSDILESAGSDVPIYTAHQSLMDEVAGFPIHRGVLACARKGEPLELDAFRGANTLLVLSGLSNHDNVGAAFRNAAAFGADGVLLDAESCDPLYRKAIRVSAGTALWLPFHHGATAQGLMDWLEASGFNVWALTPDPAAPALSQTPVPGKVALMLGAEGPGLPPELMTRATPVRIAMREDVDSLNVATAGAIALSHVFSSRKLS